jgi:hypothetical protein
MAVQLADSVRSSNKYEMFLEETEQTRRNGKEIEKGKEKERKGNKRRNKDERKKQPLAYEATPKNSVPKIQS